MQTLGLLVETESQHFIKHLPIFLPHIQQCLLPNGPGTTMEEVEEGKKEEEDSSNEDMQEEDCVLMETDKTDSKLSERIGEDKLKTGDHLLFTTLSTLSKILQECDVIRSPDFSSELKEIWSELLITTLSPPLPLPPLSPLSLPPSLPPLYGHAYLLTVCVHSLLLHPHAWVRLLSSRILGHLFAAFSPDEFVTKVGSEVVETCRQEGDGCGFKRGKGGKKVKDLLDSCVFQNSVLKVSRNVISGYKTDIRTILFQHPETRTPLYNIVEPLYSNTLEMMTPLYTVEPLYSNTLKQGHLCII